MSEQRKYYGIHLDEKHQCIVIDDQDGKVIVRRELPTTITPYPGRDAIMARPENLAAWQEVFDLCAATWR